MKGRPVKNNFNVVLPKDVNVPLEYIWALINSPLANAFVYCHSGERHNTPGIVKKIPLPMASANNIHKIAVIAKDYIKVASEINGESAGGDKADEAEKILLKLDAEVLRLYDLSPRMEKRLLDLFSGYRRRGVMSFPDRYFPEDFESCFHLHEYISEEFKRSTAGELLKRQSGEIPEEIKKALRKATESF